jgi:hypothetical protein
MKTLNLPATFSRYENEGKAFLHRVTADETWAHHYVPATNRLWSTTTRFTFEKKSRKQASMGKFLASFWDADGVFHLNVLEPGSTIIQSDKLQRSKL